jgi:hypothetical protein
MDMYENSDFVHSLNMLSGTLANLRVDSPSIMSNDSWEFVLEAVGAEAYKLGKRGKWQDVRLYLSSVVMHVSMEDAPASLKMRLRETISAIDYEELI